MYAYRLTDVICILTCTVHPRFAKMDKCYICREARPCCGGLVHHMMRVEEHRGHTVEVPDLKKTWGLGRVF